MKQLPRNNPSRPRLESEHRHGWQRRLVEPPSAGPLVISVAAPDPSFMAPRHTAVNVTTSSSIPPELQHSHPPSVDVTTADNLMSLFACCLPMSVIILISNGKLNLKQIISWLILMHCTNKHPYKQKWKATANYELNMWAGTMILILKTTTIRF